jgi:hypothetical protein
MSINSRRLIFCFADDTSIIIDDINKNHIRNKFTHVLNIIKLWFDVTYNLLTFLNLIS